MRDHGNRNLLTAFPEGLSERLMLRKMESLIDKGLVSGCACGCRGDFQITEKGMTDV